MALAGLLLDTHVLLWWLLDAPDLSEPLKAKIETEPDVHVSAATVWEVAIKQARGKLRSPASLAGWIGDSDFYELPIEYEHAAEAARLPPHHVDPFDRILVAQARCERLTLVTMDERIKAYDVAVLSG